MTKAPNNALNSASFIAMKQEGRKISMITAYDFSMASCVAQSDVDIILVGDSLGMVVLGYDNTLQVTMDDIIYHSAAVRRGAPKAFIIADMPYLSYHLSDTNTKQNAAELIIKGNANAIKLEGGSASRLNAIRAIVDIEIPVCAHLGLTPQSVHRFGGYKVQGRSPEEHEEIFIQAKAIEQAGAFMLVLEGIPELLGKEISESLSIPTIGIGAGRYTDGQVLVYHDLLGYSNMQPKFVKQYAALNTTIAQAISSYTAEVRNGSFPTEKQTYYPISNKE
ncbi:MAG: 3-methyl-2-oxobutanoate hydroxymethyltransferase [Candidatus Cloacimonetes bacterium HGW-Cloacimonetes-3]|jgi:3-methyl-2-oxobutanoate hydroxymethyltransferase|nr:MAG: 3-methyl-2-oxobutanoate hydroxymethyltransferase [Candidatus Cloacimonetes bacterium HGW-Cloacimonetes-3]